MTAFISHRGNLNGPNPAMENHPSYIDEAIKAGFVVEVDLRLVGKEHFFGHDYPQYAVTEDWIYEREDSLLLHCKDFPALKAARPSWHVFCHTNDPFTVTSRGFIWLHDLSLTPDSNTIVPLMTTLHIAAYPKYPIYAICSDHRVDGEGNVYVPRGTP
jgi:hypothetical protein